ncbi:MAG: hypothetical protein CL678_09230 [Bdellovibrionaceae bacterium]|nr:hypothetical protein [Pseudobdellovibrionaceae bacterium]|tara:strand:- start:572 stop:889 length:318 start_codon:yes stop_codon:yes gene_type:complete
MRLSQQEVNLILNVLLEKPLLEVRLSGSRVDDFKKGGDIDLLLICQNEEIRQQMREQKPEILSELKEKIGDQKIDLTIVDPSLISQDPVIEAMMNHSIVLKKNTL